jgi:uncharacterized membrane protein YbhN (UPF0104 family)
MPAAPADAPFSPAGPGWKRWLGPTIAVVAFTAAMWVLIRELRQHPLSELGVAFRSLPASRLGLAVGLTALNYTLLSGYDGLAVWYLGRSLPPRRVMLGAFVGYAFGHNLTWMLGGTTVRFRLYLKWGLSALEVAKMFALLGLTFWSGYCVLAGVVFLLVRLPLPLNLHLPLTNTAPLGLALLASWGVYLVGCFQRWAFSIGGLQLRFPPPRLAVSHVVLASCDLLLQISVLYTLLPTGLTVPFWHFASAFLLAYGAALASHVPGGLGVLETAILILVGPEKPPALFASLLVFRGIFYLLPLVLASLVFAAYEWRDRHRPPT